MATSLNSDHRPEPMLTTLRQELKHPWRALLHLAILAVSAHSVIAGICLLGFPSWMLRVVGWSYSGDIFWPRQAGLFLLILGIAYGAAIWYRPIVWLLIGSKASALVFLLSQALWLEAPRLTVPLGLIDGSMGLAVFVLLLLARRGEVSASGNGSGQ